MLLLLADSLLLLFITMNLGVLARKGLEKLFQEKIEAGLLDTFLLGLLFCSVYFNILSFWWPVNYLSLIPLAIGSVILSFLRRGQFHPILRSLRAYRNYFPPLLLPFTALLAVLFYYWILPPANDDSKTYHYLSILWYEKYKVIPGLGNVFGRFAFNPVSFIIQAPWSFTGLTGQSLYPLNGVLSGLFLGWLLVRVGRSMHSWTALLYFVLMLIFYRPLLINISSPSSDVLVTVCGAYALIRLMESIGTKNITVSSMIVPVLVILFSLSAKLSSFPLLLLLPFIYGILTASQRRGALLWKIGVIAGLLYLPWLGRNYIMSGYLFYPLRFPDWFHPDWKVPAGNQRFETYFINIATRYPDHTDASQPLRPFPFWFLPWLSHFFRLRLFVDPVIFILAFLSPLYWLLPRRLFSQNPSFRHLFFLWLIVYAAVLIWLLTAPEFRFGAPLLGLSIAIPFITLLSGSSIKKPSGFRMALNILFVVSSVYFIAAGAHRRTTYAFSLKDCWLFPPKDIAYKKQETGFRYKLLSGGVRLYLSDETHDCINAGLPCMIFDYEDIEMRGDRIEQGFRTTRDRVDEVFPIINSK